MLAEFNRGRDHHSLPLTLQDRIMNEGTKADIFSIVVEAVDHQFGLVKFAVSHWDPILSNHDY